MLRLLGKKICVFADLRKFKVRKSQKDGVRKSQIRKVPHLRNVRKPTKLQYLSPQICGFAICGTYLLTANMFKLVRVA
jgi:hypothetical protein